MDWVRWSATDAITFKAIDGRNQPQIYRLKVPSGKLDALTVDPTVMQSLYWSQGDAVLYFSWQRLPDTSRAYPVLAIPRKANGDIDLAPPAAAEYSLKARLGNGETWVVEQARHSLNVQKVWFSPDASRAVLLTGAGFRLVDFAHRTSRPLENASVQTDPKLEAAVSWARDGLPIIEYRQRVAAPATQAPDVVKGLAVAIKQGRNDPPRLVVSDGRHEKTLSQPDPALEGLRLARLEPISWKASDGTDVWGELSLPPGGGRNLPLVIQIGYQFDEHDLFMPDGPIAVAFARQSLNARGFAVLSLDATTMQGSKKRGTPEEGPGMVDQIDSAVEMLAQKGLVDPARVGLVGFSRTGYQVFYAVTHPQKTKFAAAEVADATTFNYVKDLFVEVATNGAGVSNINGGRFWDNEESWLRHDLLFNIDRMQAPTLFVQSDPEGELVRTSGRTLQDHFMLHIAEIGALMATHRPFEMLFMPEVSHSTLIPRQRQAWIAATTEWMAFWLGGTPDPSPAKAEQYRRWEQIRTRWRAQQAWEAAGHPATSAPDAAFVAGR
jgi:hypothetical protein